MVRGATSGLLVGGWLYQCYGAIRMFELQAAGIGAMCMFYFGVVAGPHALRETRRHRHALQNDLEGQLLESQAKGE